MKLSKSLYTRGLQCSKSLWLKKYNKKALTEPDKSAAAIFKTGDEVGGLACELFPNGKEIPFEGTTFEDKIALTKQWIDEGLKNIYEATFEYDDILVMVDILHVNNDNSVEIYEVKSSTEVKDVYLDDASIQYYVLNGLGYKVVKTSIVHINNNYVIDEELEIDKLFSIVDVSNEIVELQVNIPSHLKNLRNYLSQDYTLLKDNEPEKQIGLHCTKPYPCDAMNHCWANIPEYSIFNIANLKTTKKFELFERKIIDFKDIDDLSIFSETQQVQIKSELEQKTIINKSAIKEFIDGLDYPLYHLDFETFQQAVPKWKGITPYMQIPFQFSLHIENENQELQHKEFLAVEGIDPRYELAKRLVEDVPTDVTVLAYNMGFEKGVIRKLAGMYDEFSAHLIKIHDNVQDLMIPFQKKDYYVPQMRGSYSIKYVLPALVPEMAKAYEELDYIQNGSDAMQTYPLLVTMEDKEEVAKLREALLRYCELDTLAMVKVLEKLKESAK